MRVRRFILAVVCIFYFVSFIYRSAVILDPDFGWHLQFGRLIAQTHTIPATDPYSYSMPGYHFVDHEWGTDTVIAALYDTFGIWPLNVLFALLAVGALYFLGRSSTRLWSGMLVFLIGGTLLEFVGIRPQIITWVALAFLVNLLWQRKLWLHWRWYIPLLFLLWANFHGGFAIGIILVGWFVLGEMIENRKFDKNDGIIFVISLTATLCNPYGYHLWTEVAKSAVDPNLHFAIQEWYPAMYFSNIAFWIYVAISLSFIIRYRKKFSYTALGMYLLLFIAGLWSMRNIPIFLIVSFYPTVQGLQYFYEEAGKHLYGKERFVRGYFFFFIISVCFYLPQVGVFVYGTFLNKGQNPYPAGAVSYLKHHHIPTGNIFSSYDWGGYLIWRLPEKKVFIDGRMPSWRNPTAPSGESTYAFGDYGHILDGSIPFITVVKKYNIHTILFATSNLKKQQLVIFGIDVQKNPILKPFFISNTSFALVATQAKQMGWKEVYRDKTAVIFEDLNN